MKAKSIKGNSPEEIKDALHQSTTDGFKPTLAIVFLSIKQDCDAVCKILDDAGIAIYGATSNGEFTGEGITAGEIAILLLDIKEEQRRQARSFAARFLIFAGPVVALLILLLFFQALSTSPVAADA